MILNFSMKYYFRLNLPNECGLLPSNRRAPDDSPSKKDQLAYPLVSDKAR
jgi:hypothetical protein